MISILIPTFNYNISALVCEVHNQASIASIDFEIICFEDGSEKLVDKNRSCIDKLSNSSLLISNTNIGRTNARQRLAQEAKYDFLLFLDSDVFPKKTKFIENYFSQLRKGNDVTYGGIAYSSNIPNQDFMLRWKYGRTFEEVGANKRNLNPYQVTTSGNFLIKKSIFLLINSNLKHKKYGLDNYFSALLKKNNFKVIHIDNEVFHLGLDKSAFFLQKTEESIETLIWMLKKKHDLSSKNKLMKYYNMLKKYRLNILLSIIFQSTSPFLKKNLLGSNPNMFLFQFYKIGYMCRKNQK
ncbi:glycosyltransferase [uncultured Algibacter sp.]|uniref:glycosyltransferase family 2 protein n=1 Tax=uncultured Algibacter sp. TaxID=298659 RepID=UPI002637EE80|nr:glycosyltransferase [uncultured Algibacter sp.]